MKPFWIVCLAAVGFMGIMASCGPKHRYCPNEPDMECHVYDDGGGPGGAGGMSVGPCDGGAISVGSDGAITCL